MAQVHSARQGWHRGADQAALGQPLSKTLAKKMKFDPTITVASIVIGVGLLFTVATLLLNFVQLRRNWRVQKAQFLANITNDLFDDTDLRKFYYAIDYEKFNFAESKLDEFKGSDQERYLDALLYR